MGSMLPYIAAPMDPSWVIVVFYLRYLFCGNHRETSGDDLVTE